MTERRRILRRAARITTLSFGAAGLALLAVTAIYEDWRQGRLAERERAREQRIAEAREYLAQAARRVTRLPVDPAVQADIQSRHFEERRTTRLLIWATDNAGAFLFGVPGDEFARLNAAYDRHRQQLDKDGFYPDRQAFLQRLAGHDEIDFGVVEDGPRQPSGWRYRRVEEGFRVYSVPMKAEDGGVIGTLYLKVSWPYEWDPRSELGDVAQGVLAAVLALSGLFLWFLLPTWVYVDARERGVPRARLWALLTFISLVVGLVVYLIARPEQATVLSCPGCGREVNGGAFCPHCARDLAAAFCSACRYPLKPDWLFCPSCRSEVRRPAAGGPPAGGSPAAGRESGSESEGANR